MKLNAPGMRDLLWPITLTLSQQEMIQMTVIAFS